MTDRRVAGRSALLTRSDGRRLEPRLINGAAHGYVIGGASDFFSDEICPALPALPATSLAGEEAGSRHGTRMAMGCSIELRDPINQLAAAELPRGFGRD